MRRAAGDTGRPALRRCVGVDAAAFAERYWGRRPLLTPAAGLPRDFTDLLGLADVDELLSRRGLRTPFLRLAKDGQVVPAGRFTGPGGVGAGVADQVRDDLVADLFADGSTVVLQALHRSWAPVADFAAALTTDLGHPVQVNAYVTPPQSQGFSSHYDVHDVFVLQVAGEKRWRIHAPVRPDPLRADPWTGHRDAVAAAAREAPYLDALLRPGDALYLPRGWLHAASALGEVSAHLTVGIHVTTRAAIVAALADLVLDDPALRATLPLGTDVTDPAALAPHVDATVAALAARLRATTPASVAAALTGPALAAARPAPVPPLAQAAAARGCGPSTRVRRRPHLRLVVRDEPGHVVLVLDDRRLRLPVSARAAVDVLLGGDAVAVADLPGVDADDAVTLVRRLLREAVVVPADAPAA